MSIAEIRRLPLHERLQIMEAIWEDMRVQADAVLMPAWQGELLDARRRAVAEGRERILDWDEVKSSLGSQRGGGTMKTVTLEVLDPSNVMDDFVKAWTSGKEQSDERIVFATPELLWKVLTAKRWDLLKVLCGAGPVSIREAARRLSRDVKAVHSDVTALLMAGVLQRTAQGQIEFPFDAVKVEFLLQAA